VKFFNGQKANCRLKSKSLAVIFAILQVTNGEFIAVENEFFGHA
jgi:hypothetical protein